MKLDYDALLVLASNFRNRTVRLSDESLALFISLTGYSDQRWQWENNGQPLNAAQWEVIDALVARAALEIMTPLIGWIVPVVLATLPDGWLECDGSTYLAADYPELWAVLASEYKTSGTEFVTPDLRDRVAVGIGGEFAINEQGGIRDVTLTVDQLPAHTHTDAGHQHSAATFSIEIETFGADVPIPVIEETIGLTGVGYADIQSTGGGQAFDNMQPWTAVRYAIIAR